MDVLLTKINMAVYFNNTDLGKIGIAETGGQITNVFFETDICPKEIEIAETPLLKEAFCQLEDYLKGKIEVFTLPISLTGTAFMREVWNSLLLIPYGKTATYKEIAAKVNSPKAFRAVGLANNRNPVPVFIPCHRVIGADGALTGYRGGIEMKRKLLELEKGI